MNSIPFLLRAKTMQVFGVLVLIPVAILIAALIILFFNFELTTVFSVYPFIALPVYIPFFIWNWNIGIWLHDKLPEELRFHRGVFKIAFGIMLFCLIVSAFLLHNLFGSTFMNNASLEPSFSSLGIFIPFLIATLFIMFCLAYVSYYNARTIRTLERNEAMKFSECFEDMQWIFVIPLGIWNLQPRINKIAHSTKFELIEIDNKER